MKILAINGSPRTNGNTATLLQMALQKGEALGHTTELVQLAQLNIRGCRSCFACKLDSAPWNQNCACAVQDDLTAVLQKVQEADALLIGTPVYFCNFSSDTLAFLERLWFSANVYDEAHSSLWPHRIPTGFVITTNAPDPNVFQSVYQMVCNFQNRIIGPTQLCTVGNTCQFDDYSRYYAPVFDVANKEKRRVELMTTDREKVERFIENLLSL